MEPTQLLDELRNEAVGLGLQGGELLRVLEEGHDAEVDHVDHCGVAGDEEEEGDLHDVGLFDVAREELLGYEFAD